MPEQEFTHPLLPLAGRVAVVTGAARGIGEAIAHSLALMGARVVLVARDQNRLEQVKTAIEKFSGLSAVMPCDLMSEPAIAGLGKRITTEYGRCDILVNNAGIGIIGKTLVDFSPEEWEQTLSTNLRAPYLMIRALAPLMISARSGHIINISSLAGRNPLPQGAAYAASKWGLNGLTYSVAEELRSFNIKVAVIAPGSVNTHFGSGEESSSQRAARMIQPQDVARMVATLVTEPANSFVSEVLMRPTVKP